MLSIVCVTNRIKFLSVYLQFTIFKDTDPTSMQVCIFFEQQPTHKPDIELPTCVFLLIIGTCSLTIGDLRQNFYFILFYFIFLFSLFLYYYILGTLRRGATEGALCSETPKLRVSECAINTMYQYWCHTDTSIGINMVVLILI